MMASRGRGAEVPRRNPFEDEQTLKRMLRLLTNTRYKDLKSRREMFTMLIYVYNLLNDNDIIDREFERQVLPPFKRWLVNIVGESLREDTLRSLQQIFNDTSSVWLEQWSLLGFAILQQLDSINSAVLDPTLKIVTAIVALDVKLRDELVNAGLLRKLVRLTGRRISDTIRCSAALCLESVFIYANAPAAADAMPASFRTIRRLFKRDSDVVVRVVCSCLPTIFRFVDDGHIWLLLGMEIFGCLISLADESDDEAVVQHSLDAINTMVAIAKRITLSLCGMLPTERINRNGVSVPRDEYVRLQDAIRRARAPPTDALVYYSSGGLIHLMDEIGRLMPVLVKRLASRNVETRRLAVTTARVLPVYMVMARVGESVSPLSEVLRPLVVILVRPDTELELRTMALRAVGNIIDPYLPRTELQRMRRVLATLDLTRLNEYFVEHENQHIVDWTRTFVQWARRT